MKKKKKLKRSEIEAFKEKMGTDEYTAAFTYAGFNKSEISRISETFEKSTVFMGKGWIPPKSKAADTSKVTGQVFEKLIKSNLFDTLNNINEIAKEGTVKENTGSELINKVTKLNSIRYGGLRDKQSQDFKDLYKATKNFENIYKNGGSLISYDLETLGGINSVGHQQVDFITEFSVSLRDVKGINNIKLPKKEDFKTEEEWKKAYKAAKNNLDELAPVNKSKSVSSLFGLSQSEYDQVYKYVSSLRGKNKLNVRDSVTLKRLSMMTDKNLKLSNTNDFFINIEKASDEYKVSIDSALEGLKKYREIGKTQEAWLKANNINDNLESYKKKVVQKVANFVNHGVDFEGNKIDNFVTLGHNINNFDNPVLRIIGGDKESLAKGVFEHEYGKMFDSYQAIKAIEQNVGLDAHIPNTLKVSKEFGIGTQDALKKIFSVISDVTAHNAREDEQALSGMMFSTIPNSKKNTSLAEHFFGLMHKANYNRGKTGSEIHGFDGEKGVFL